VQMDARHDAPCDSFAGNKVRLPRVKNEDENANEYLFSRPSAHLRARFRGRGIITNFLDVSDR
jgi:hypothetical protein